MHTRVDIVFCIDTVRNDLVEIASEIEREIAKYENIANRFNPESELSYVNENAFGKAIAISPELCEILADCRQYNSETFGYFDITVNSQNGCKENTNAFIIQPESNTIEFFRAGIVLDLSGFIKGYTLGKVVQIIKNKDIENALINIGNSSVYAKGNHPHGTGWKIRIPATGLECTLLNECLTTSGNDEATKYPIINPKNGKIERVKQAVSVITKSPAVGEVLSKVAFLASEFELNRILKKFDGEIIKS
ncbi:MAG: FAD:protein FMN transferase [Paludibacter sp.]|nr:FAD:protein FMN transferase [Paludibacter sp.]